jgi:sugar/nucleoside kinase (ribokinase family)
LTVQPGGAPFNIAIGLRRLGESVRFAGALSDDPFGTRLAELLAAEGVARVPEEPLAVPTRLALVDHSPSGAGFRFYGERPADARISRTDIERALSPATTGLYVSSLMLLDTRASEVQQHAVQLATSRGIPIFTDPNPRPLAWANGSLMRAAVIWLLGQATLAKLSLEDARGLGWPAEPLTLLRFVAERWRAQLVITDGHNGCWTVIDGRVIHQQGFTVDAVDPTGAGDAFFAALIHRYLIEGRLSPADLRFATAAGALAACRLGAVAGLPTDTQIATFLDLR